MRYVRAKESANMDKINLEMEELKEKFTNMQTTDKIASLHLIVATLVFFATAISISIGYLAYSINTAVEARNKVSWKIAQATHL